MINIQDIIPFMKKGWVAMDKSGQWWWFEEKPIKSECDGNIWVRKNPCNFECVSRLFDIVPADDWTRSLIKIDNTAREKFEEEYQNNIQRTIQELKQDE